MAGGIVKLSPTRFGRRCSVARVEVLDALDRGLIEATVRGDRVLIDESEAARFDASRGQLALF